MNWFEQGNWSNFWSEAQKRMPQWPANIMPFAAGTPFPSAMPFGGGMPFAPGAGFPGFGGAAAGGAAAPEGGGGSGNTALPAGFAFEKVNELIKQTLEGWAAFTPGAGKKGATVDNEMLAKLFDPSQWSQVMSSGPDLSLERLTEGPTYATVTDIDRKILKAQQLWLERARDIEGYRQVVQAAWLRAFEAMRKSLADPKGEPLTSARAVLDLWLSCANEALLEMHHRPEFLEAQRKMTRSAAEYRLQEQQLAEVFCSLNHIPTRTEMDEAQKTIQELRREVRALKRGLEGKRPVDRRPEEKQPENKRPVAKRPAAKKERS